MEQTVDRERDKKQRGWIPTSKRDVRILLLISFSGRQSSTKL